MASFVVKAAPKGWRLLQQVYKQGQRSEITVPSSAYLALGFSAHMTRAEAKARASELNAANSIDKHRAANIARKLTVEAPLIESAYLPADLVFKFTDWLKNNSNGSAEHVSKIVVHWALVQKLISELQIEPFEYSDNSKRIYKLFRDRKYSLDYSCKLLRLFNQWGNFVCKRRGQFFEPVKPPTGQSKEQIVEAYEESQFYRAGGSLPLTLPLLAKLKDKLPKEQFDWLAVSLWFGLRPSEVLGTHEINENSLSVYQPKLVHLPKRKRWKHIPINEPEQRALMAVIASRALKRPLAKTIKKHLGIQQISCYAGRKGFVNLMMARGHSFFDASVWAGHQTLDRTYRTYLDRSQKPA